MALLFKKSRPIEVRSFINDEHVSSNQTNCSLHAIIDYPGWFIDKPPRYDYIFYCSVIAVYLFFAIAIVCDKYCVPAVERICYKFSLSYDVAGATLMALASSSPEFFINFYATFLTEGDMGLGTIVGSSLFNTLAITACCCFYTGMDFSIDWWPITRDLLWYSLSVLLLTLFLWDGFVLWYESGVLVILYLFYILNLLMDKKCQAKLRTSDKPCWLKCFVPQTEVKDFVEMEDPDNDEQPFDFFHCSKNSHWQTFIWLVSYPLECIFVLTIPDIRRECSHGCNCLCLIMSIFWISLLTYLCSWVITVIGYHLFIPDSVMGLVILAAGTSIPEAISSVIVTKKGYGSMAICNAVGSNTTDILICLGAPWLIKSFFFSVSSNKQAIFIISDGLAYSTACLLLSAILLYISFMVTRFQLNRFVGISSTVMYITFIVVAVVLEMLLFRQSLPHCLLVKGL